MSVFISCHLQNTVMMPEQLILLNAIYTRGLQAWLDNCCYTNEDNSWAIISSLLLKIQQCGLHCKILPTPMT